MSLTVRIELSDDEAALIAPFVPPKAVIGAIAWREAIRKVVTAVVLEDFLGPLRVEADARKQALLAQLERKETE